MGKNLTSADLRAFRKKNRLTIKQLSLLINTPIGTIENWERDHKPPGCLIVALQWVLEHYGTLEEVRKKHPKIERVMPTPERPLDTLWEPPALETPG